MGRRIVIWAISLVMALTCFVPMSGYVYATDDGSQQATTTAPENSDASFTGWKSKGDKKYYYKNDKLYTGWLTVNGVKRYLKNGSYLTGWVKVKGKKYYCKKGTPLKGIKKVKKVYYEFNKNSGVLKRKIGDKMDLKAQNYKSKRKYLVLVSKKKHRVRIYKGKKNKWKRIKNFKCTVGKSSTPTPSGTYRITSRGRYFNTGSNLRCWYWTGFIGARYLFHSVLYNRNSSPTHVVDGRLGRNLSHGCIRLSLKNAKWIKNNVPGGSKVVIKNNF